MMTLYSMLITTTLLHVFQLPGILPDLWASQGRIGEADIRTASYSVGFFARPRREPMTSVPE